MNQAFRQRLVGALVLLALAVILVPLLFDFSARQPVDTTTRIPVAPVIEPVAFPEPVRPDDLPADSGREPFLIEEIDEDGAAPVAEQISAPVVTGVMLSAEPDNTIETLEAIPPAEGWVIQVGSFSSHAGAEGLLQALIDDGYKAYYRTQNRGGRELYLIYVGPFLSEAEARRQQQAIDGQHAVQSLLRRFVP